jgi:hypothetical protein
MSKIALFLIATLLAGCAFAGGPSISDEARCRQDGGMWRTTYCDPGGGGGGGGY